MDSITSTTRATRADLAESFRVCIEIGDTLVPDYLTSVPPEVAWMALGDALAVAFGGDLYKAAETVTAMLHEAREITRGMR